MFPYVNNKHIEKKQHHIILPSCAAWFNFDTVHEIEKRALPEWFNVKKVGTVGAPPSTAATAVVDLGGFRKVRGSRSARSCT